MPENPDMLDNLKLIEAEIDAAVERGGEEAAQFVRDKIGNYAFLFKLALEQSRAAWDRFSGLLDRIPEGYLRPIDLLILCKTGFEPLPQELVDKFKAAFLKQSFENSPERFLDKIYHDLKCASLYDDMPDAVSGAFADVVIGVIDALHADNVFARVKSWEWAAVFYMSVYVNGREVRDPDTPMNKKLLEKYTGLVDGHLQDIADDVGRVSFLCKAIEGKYPAMREALFERVQRLLEAEQDETHRLAMCVHIDALGYEPKFARLFEQVWSIMEEGDLPDQQNPAPAPL